MLYYIVLSHGCGGKRRRPGWGKQVIARSLRLRHPGDVAIWWLSKAPPKLATETPELKSASVAALQESGSIAAHRTLTAGGPDSLNLATASFPAEAVKQRKSIALRSAGASLVSNLGAEVSGRREIAALFADPARVRRPDTAIARWSSPRRSWSPQD